jgi:hypothetical protein
METRSSGSKAHLGHRHSSDRRTNKGSHETLIGSTMSSLKVSIAILLVSVAVLWVFFPGSLQAWPESAAAGETPASETSAEQGQPKAIYGDDDRLDEFEVTNHSLLAFGDSTVALVPQSDLTDNGDGTYTLPTQTFAQWYLAKEGRPLCDDEPFRDQPNPASCSGFLVGPDVIATAGHCIHRNPGCPQGKDCADVAFVFGFVMEDPDTPVLRIPASDIYYCNGIIDCEEDDSDWMLVRLDRKVVGHDPLLTRISGKVANGTDLLVIGHPVGLPRKYASGATVRDNDPIEYFEANLDTYHGNSGSPVFNAETMIVEGILVRGNPDFVQDGPCDRSNACPDANCPIPPNETRWEQVTRATEFTDVLLESIPAAYVDDDAPGDPGPHDPLVSDPSEDGSREHAFDTVQEAYNVATDGYTIIIRAGVYPETITFAKKLVIRAQDGDARIGQ